MAPVILTISIYIWVHKSSINELLRGEIYIVNHVKQSLAFSIFTGLKGHWLAALQIVRVSWFTVRTVNQGWGSGYVVIKEIKIDQVDTTLPSFVYLEVESEEWSRVTRSQIYGEMDIGCTRWFSLLSNHQQFRLMLMLFNSFNHIFVYVCVPISA